ncbi:MAG: hypothetical protein AB198_02530 [Parcubacteria bacterium C7867-003]|nr:MAG: hypothetical protein AB198_02530 [Parcubacteria bacterium C7867-003]
MKSPRDTQHMCVARGRNVRRPMPRNYCGGSSTVASSHADCGRVGIEPNVLSSERGRQPQTNVFCAAFKRRSKSRMHTCAAPVAGFWAANQKTRGRISRTRSHGTTSPPRLKPTKRGPSALFISIMISASMSYLYQRMSFLLFGPR